MIRHARSPRSPATRPTRQSAPKPFADAWVYRKRAMRARRLQPTVALLAFFAGACRHSAPVQTNRDDVVRTKDAPVVVAPKLDTIPTAVFKDTGAANVFSAPGTAYTIRTPAQRQSFLAILRRERALWQSRKPHDYQFLLRVGCFCPGTRGWLLIQVRSGQPLRAWDRTGKPVSITDWNTLSIDALYDNLEQWTNSNAEIRIAFDARWHFPSSVQTVALPGPDAWSTIEVRALRPI